MKNLLTLFFAMLLLATPALIDAHGGGEHVTEEVGDYLVDIEYSQHDPFVGELIVFDFNLTELDDPRVSPFSDLWLRISKEGKTFFAGRIKKPEFGPTAVTYVFSEEGEYEISSRFYNEEGSTLAEHDFLLYIDASEENEGRDSIASIVLSAFGGFIFGIILSKFFLGFLAFEFWKNRKEERDRRWWKRKK